MTRLFDPRVTLRSLRLLGLAAALALGAACSQAGCRRGGREPGRPARTRARRGGRPLIALIRAADWMGSEWGEDAIKLGLRESDMEAGRDYELKISSAQGDLATLPSLIDAAMDAKAKVIVTLQDATLQAAVQRAKAVPIVFNLLSDPVRRRGRHQRLQPPAQHHRRLLAGLRRSGADAPGRADQDRSCPRPRRIGVLFSPEEQLSVIFKDRMTKPRPRRPA